MVRACKICLVVNAAIYGHMVSCIEFDFSNCEHLFIRYKKKIKVPFTSTLILWAGTHGKGQQNSLTLISP